ncbi:hypothetical protein ACFTZM_35540, partial [Streptomyces hydrogenans]
DDRTHEAVTSVPRHVSRTLSGARRRFLAVNGAVFLLAASLSSTAGELFATRPASTVPLGLALGALQLVVLLLTSWWYDRTLRRHVDPLVDLTRGHADLVHASPSRPGPAETTSRRPHSAQGRRR